MLSHLRSWWRRDCARARRWNPDPTGDSRDPFAPWNQSINFNLGEAADRVDEAIDERAEWDPLPRLIHWLSELSTIPGIEDFEPTPDAS